MTLRLRRTRFQRIAASVLIVAVCASVTVVPAAADDDANVAAQRAAAVQAAVARIAPSLVRIEMIGGIVRNQRATSGESTTSGIIVSSDGHVITSSFALRYEPRSILVRLPDGTRHAATQVARDHTRGLSLLKIDVQAALPEPTLTSPDGLRIGQTAIAVGRAIDEETPNVSVGIISALSRAGGRAIQTDANTSWNDYGGALIDLEGRLIGVVVPVAPLVGGIVADLDLYDSGIGFAIPAEQVYAALDRLKQGTDLLPGKLGVGLDVAKTIDAPAVVALCRPNSDAYRQGVRPGDRIIAIAAAPIDRQSQLGERLATHYAGDTVAVTLKRGDETRDLDVQLLAEFETYEPPVIGVLPAPNVQPQADGDNAGETHGVAIRRVLADGPASKAGIQAGDRIVALDGDAASDAAQLRSLIEDHRVGDTVKLSVERDDERLDVDVTLAASTDTSGEQLDTDGEAADDLTVTMPEVEQLDIPDFDTAASVFAVGDDHDRGQSGLIVWLTGEKDEKITETMHGWATICAQQRWILVAIKPNADKAGTAKPTQLAGAIEFCRDHLRTNPDRTVLMAQGDRALIAWQAALMRGDLCRGVMAIEPTQLGPVRELMPGHTFCVFLSTVDNEETTKRAEAVVEKLHEWNYTITTATTSQQLTAVPTSPSKEIRHWLDGVDRL